jgi:hypothetical protein
MRDQRSALFRDAENDQAGKQVDYDKDPEVNTVSMIKDSGVL